MKSRYAARSRTAGLLVVLAMLGSCSTGHAYDVRPPQASKLADIQPPDDGPLPLLVPYRGLMIGVVELSAYRIFDLAARNATPSDEEWTGAGLDAVNLIAISTLLSMQGSGHADGPRHNDPSWRLLVDDFQSAGVLVAMAVDQRDRKDLQRSAELLAGTCQSCHERFKIPPDRRASDFAAR